MLIFTIQNVVWSDYYRNRVDGTLDKKTLYVYYTIIDFNEVDIRIYLPEKVIIHRGRKAEVNITFKGR